MRIGEPLRFVKFSFPKLNIYERTLANIELLASTFSELVITRFSVRNQLV